MTALKPPVVLLAVDDTPQSEYAAYYYLERVHREEYHVVVAHAVELPDKGYNKSVQKQHALSEGRAGAGAAGKQVENKFFELLKSRGVTHLRGLTRTGYKLEQVICELAGENDAMMVVMGSRGLGKIKRSIQGSVSDYVAHHVTCPVLVCKLPERESKSRTESLLRSEGIVRNRADSSPPGRRPRSSTLT